MLRPGAVAVALAVLAVAACQSPPPSTSFPELTYGHLEPIRMAAAAVEVEDAYVPPLQAPHVEHRMPLAPAAAAMRWARDRLQPGGPDGRLVFTIVDASVIETTLRGTEGLEGVFTTDQAERYDATLAVELDLYDRAGVLLGGIASTIRRARTVAEDVTLAERERVWFEMTSAMVADLNDEMEVGIRRHLIRFRR